MSYVYGICTEITFETLKPINHYNFNFVFADKQFIALGFGGLVNGRVRHCFPLNGNTRQPQCRGIEGVIDAYYHSLENGAYVLFSPIISLYGGHHKLRFMRIYRPTHAKRSFAASAAGLMCVVGQTA